MTDKLRARASHQALAVPVEPASRLDPSGFDPSRLNDAIAFAAHCHKGQLDKGGQPYILHPIRVMLRLNGEDQRIAAMLHDVVEDCGVEPVYIRMCYGDRVGDAVDALTRGEDESYDDFIERCGANDVARSVKWADLCDNMNLSRLPRVTEADRARNLRYSKARLRLTAIAMEARSGETEGLDPKDESAGPQDIAQGIDP